MTQTKAEIKELKETFIRYFRDVPIQKYAAQFIKRDDDTISYWKKHDPKFTEDIKQAEAEFISKALNKTKADWKLERIFKKDFSARTEITGADGQDLIPKPLLGGNSVEIIEVRDDVSGDNGNKALTSPQ